MLLNERVVLKRGGDEIYIAGIDDAHFYRVDNIEKAAEGIPEDAFSILLCSRTEDRHAARQPGAIRVSGAGLPDRAEPLRRKGR